MEVTFTGLFLRTLKRLSRADAEDTTQAVKNFINNPNSKSLNFEKVRSRAGYFTIRANFKTRVLLKQRAQDKYDAVAVGNHDYVYESYFR